MGYKLLTAGQAPAFLKIIATGANGGGKTRFGIDGGTYKITKDGKIEGDGELWPGLIVISAESGVEAYEEPFEGMFQVIRTKSILVLEQVVDDIRAGKLLCGTLVIDPWTKFRNLVRKAEEDSASGDLSYREYGRINKVMENVQDKLETMPCHVILVVHEADVIDTNNKKKRGAGITNEGLKLNANSSVAAWADFILWFEPKTGAFSMCKVVKARGANLGENDALMLKNASWKSTFKDLAARWARRKSADVPSSAQGEQDASKALGSLDKKPVPAVEIGDRDFTNQSGSGRWYKRKMAQGFSEDVIMNTLGVTKLGELGKMTWDEADAKLLAGKEVANAAPNEA